MIRSAVELKLRTLVRSPLWLLIVMLTLVTGTFAIVQGRRDVERWSEAIVAARSASLAADDFAPDLAVEARDAGESFAEVNDDEVYVALLRRFPGLEEHLPQTRPAASFVEHEAREFCALEERMAQRDALGRAQLRLVQQTGLASPVVAFTHALETIAGRGPLAGQEYRNAVVSAVTDRVQRHIARTWKADTLGIDDFEELMGATAERIEWRVKLPWTEFNILLVWTAGLAGVAAIHSRSRSRHPARLAIEPVPNALAKLSSADAARSAR